jgi:adenylate kinase
MLVDRLSGRLTCPACQSTFNERLHKLSPGDACPNCGGTLQQRPDDRRDVVQERVRVYLTQTLPVVEHYDAQGILRRINGDRPVQEVFDDLRDSVGKAEV